MANRKISDLTALTTPVTGDLLPIVDISEAAAADKNKKITYGTFLSSVPLGTAAAPSIAFTGDINTGIYSPGADQLAISTNGGGRLRVSSTGAVEIVGAGTIGSTQAVSFNGSAPVNSMVIDSSGRLLCGTSSARSGGPYGSAGLQVESTSFSNASISAINNEGTSDGVALTLGKSRGSSIGSTTIVNSGDQVGGIYFQGADGSALRGAASIIAEVDGTPGANDMPGRLVFSTTADGAASPTEALRISNNRAITVSDGGNVVLGTTTGTKIGTATTQKIGFYNATPVVQPAAVADATDAASVIARLNDLLARLRTLGIIAT